MPFYQLNLALFAGANAYLLYRQYAREQKATLSPVPSSPAEDDTSSSSDRDVESETHDDGSVPTTKEAARGFQRDFFVVYALAMAADWLQVTSLSPAISLSGLSTVIRELHGGRFFAVLITG